MAFKVHEVARPNVVDRMINREVSLVINTPLGRSAFYDDTYIRRTALHLGIPRIPTLSAATARVDGIRAIKEGVSTISSSRNSTAGSRSSTPARPTFTACEPDHGQGTVPDSPRRSQVNQGTVLISLIALKVNQGTELQNWTVATGQSGESCPRTGERSSTPARPAFTAFEPDHGIADGRASPPPGCRSREM